MRVLVGLLIVGVLITLYVIAWRLNRKTDKPEGSNSKGCDGCGEKGCSLNPLHHGGL